MKTKKLLLIILIASTLLIAVYPVEALAGTFTLVDHHDDGNSYTNAFNDGFFTYVACGADGLRIYNSTSHALLTTQYDGGYYRDVTGLGPWLAVADGGAGILFYQFLYTDDLHYSLTLNDTRYDATVDDYYTVTIDLGGSTIYCGCGGDGIIAYTWDPVTGILTLAGQQLDNDGGADYRGIAGDAVGDVWVACGTDGLRSYYFDGANFFLTDTMTNATSYTDVEWANDNNIYTACGVEGTFVYSFDFIGLTFTYLYDRTDSSGAGYINIWGNATLLYYACQTEGLRAYTFFNGTIMTLLGTVHPATTTCLGVAGNIGNDNIYYIASNDGIYTYNFTITSGGPPTVTTNPATSVGYVSATINGVLNSGGLSTVWFEWGTTIAYGHTTATQMKTDGNTFNITITGLTLNTTYHFRAYANNTFGAGNGADQTFTTLSSGGIVPVNWTSIFDGISRMFTGGNYTDSHGVTHSITGIFGGGQDTRALLGVFIFAILFILTAVWGLGILIGSVIIIPSVFAVMNYIPELSIIVAIVGGLLFGLGLNRIVRR